MKSIKLMLISGFLGAGKTTFLQKATELLLAQGRKVGLITNDQAEGLVDTAYLRHARFPIQEISGSCFCCNLPGFEEAIKSLEHVDIILAEPVGSCTDLVATIMRPLQNRWDYIELAPIVVLADPHRLTDILEGGTAGLHPDSAYIFGKQLEESDLILITKTDQLPEGTVEVLKEKITPRFPGAEVRAISALSGEGMEDILQELLTAKFSGGRRIEVDYDRYAEGEAVLGWLNGTLLLKGNKVDWDDYVRRFLQSLGSGLEEQQAPVGHIKLILENGDRYLIGSLTGQRETMNLRGKAGSSDAAKFTINARAGLRPDELDELVRGTIDVISGDIESLEIKVWQCFSPAYPVPTVRN